MRNAARLKLQTLKNRDGVVSTEPLSLRVDFASGSHLCQFDERDPATSGQDPVSLSCATMRPNHANFAVLKWRSKLSITQPFPAASAAEPAVLPVAPAIQL